MKLNSDCWLHAHFPLQTSMRITPACKYKVGRHNTAGGRRALIPSGNIAPLGPPPPPPILTTLAEQI